MGDRVTPSGDVLREAVSRTRRTLSHRSWRRGLASLVVVQVVFVVAVPVYFLWIVPGRRDWLRLLSPFASDGLLRFVLPFWAVICAGVALIVVGQFVAELLGLMKNRDR